MKKLLLVGVLMAMQGEAMDVDVEKELSPALATRNRPSSRQLINQLTDIVVNLGDDLDTNNEHFKTLVVQYFKKESIEIEASIVPHLKKKLRESDTELNKILEDDDKQALQELIDRLISDSVEAALLEKDHRFEELQQAAQNQTKKARYAFGTAIVSGVVGIVTVFLSVYFGKT